MKRITWFTPLSLVILFLLLLTSPFNPNLRWLHTDIPGFVVAHAGLTSVFVLLSMYLVAESLEDE